MPRWFLAATLVLFCCRLAPAGETKPSGKKPKKATSGADLLLGTAGMSAIVSREDAALCPICGKPLWMHTGDFVCEYPGKKRVKAKHAEVVCPVCGSRFTAPYPNYSSNRSDDLGQDADFCRHSLGTATVHSSVWTCFECGYSAFYKEFEQPLEDSDKKFVRANLAPVVRQQIEKLISIPGLRKMSYSSIRQEDVPDMIKYEAAIRFYGHRNSSPAKLARLHVKASYAYRRLVVSPLVCLRMSKAIQRTNEILAGAEYNMSDPRQVIRRGEGALATADLGEVSGEASLGLSKDTRFCIHITLAGCYDRLGEGWNAKREYVRADRSIVPSEGWKTKVRDMRSEILLRMEWLMKEVSHQLEAAKYLRKSIEAGEGSPADRVVSAYLMGELQRRLGELPSAAAWLDAALLLALRTNNPLAGRIKTQRRHEVLNSVSADEMVRELADVVRLLDLDVEGAGDAAAAAAKLGTELDISPPATSAPAPTPPTTPAGKPPASCRELLAKLYAAIERYNRAVGRPPNKLEDLVNSGLISNEEANSFVCPESNARLLYSKPERLGPRTFMIYHLHPSKCSCHNVLNADGSIAEFGGVGDAR